MLGRTVVQKPSSVVSSFRSSSSLLARSSTRLAVNSPSLLLASPKPTPAGRNFAVNKRSFSYTPPVRSQPTMSEGNVQTIATREEFNEKVINSKDTVVIDCFATWCGPCKAIAPKVAQLSETYTQAKFYQIDVDKLSDVAAELGIRAMPTFILFKNGEKVQDIVGANPPALEAGIKSLIA